MVIIKTNANVCAKKFYSHSKITQYKLSVLVKGIVGIFLTT